MCAITVTFFIKLKQIHYPMVCNRTFSSLRYLLLAVVCLFQSEYTFKQDIQIEMSSEKTEIDLEVRLK